MISLTAPYALLLAALALPIIGFYILKVRLRRIPVSTNLFWKQIYDDKPPRSLWQNLRHLISLLLQLLLLLLLVLAVADPYLPWQRNAAQRLVVVLDNSASMQTKTGDETRLQAAKRLADQTLNSMRENDEAAILVAGQTPRVIVGMTNHVPTLRRAIVEIEPSDNPTYLQSSIELAEKLLGDHPNARVLLLSDHSLADSNTDLPRPAEEQVSTSEQMDAPKSVNPPIKYDLDQRLVGHSVNNVGVVQFQVRRSLSDLIGYEILVSVRNAADQPVKCRLELLLNDLPVDVVPLRLKPDEQWSSSFEKTSLEGGTLTAKLTNIAADMDESVDPAQLATEQKPSNDELNGLAIDDLATAILPPRTIQKVLIVSPGNLFLQKAFEANPLVELTMVKDFPDLGRKTN